MVDQNARPKESKSLVLSSLGVVAFVTISIFSIRDCDLLSGNGTLTLPLLDVGMPVFGFFFATPIFLFWASSLIDADLSEADVTRVDFSTAVARGANFEGAKGSRPVFFKTELAGAHFARVHLERPNFTGADLSGADFAEASIADALLTGTDLRGANLKGCNFSGAYLEDTHLDGASYDKFTTFPAGFDARAHGMIERR